MRFNVMHPTTRRGWEGMRLLLPLAALFGLAAPGAGAAELQTPRQTGPAQQLAAPATLERSVGVQLRSGYASARAKLLRTSWKAVAGWGESGAARQRAYPQYPEVLCGEGYDAVCTGRFEKAGQAILLTIDPRTRTLRVTSIDED
jgi:hypothetical protein